MWWYYNEATFTNLLVAASFSECYTVDFACQILSCIFLKKAFSRSFFYAPLDFILWFYPFSTKFGSITYERLFYKPIEAVLFLMNTVDDIPGWTFYKIIPLPLQLNLLKTEIAQ